MGRRQLNPESDEAPNGVDTTVMAIRESLMEYFKGTCVERLVSSGNVHLEAVYGTHLYNYQRREERNTDTRMLKIGAVPILLLQKAPERVTFFEPLDRSPQLKEVKKQLEEFLVKYLSNVTKEYRNGPI